MNDIISCNILHIYINVYAYMYTVESRDDDVTPRAVRID
jgi:hypothetical protein